MKNIKLIYNITIPVLIIVLAVFVFSERNNESEPNSNVLNTILSSETINNQAPQSRNFIVRNPDFTVAAEKTINSVVHVKNTAKAKNSNSLWDLFYGNSDDRTTIGTGSGVIVSSDGYIITNNHVIENATQIEVTTNDNKSFDAELIGTDQNSDIAVLKINGESRFPYIRFADSDQTKIGEWVLAVGNPFNLTSTVTAGIISAKSRDLNDYDSKNQSFIQTDAAVNSGNSGGALVNINGDLIGINTAIQSTNAGFIGYSFAVPSNIARKIYEDILEFGDVQRGLLGVTGQSLNSQNSNELGIDITEGFYINDTDPNMGAHIAGIRKGDIIQQIDNVKINKFADLSGYLNSKRPGDKLNVKIFRNNKSLNIGVQLKRSTYVQFYGMQLKDASESELDELNAENGVKVVINRNGTLFRMGIRSGYILTEINNTQISNTSELKSFERADIFQITFVDLNGEKEKLIFD
jgi:Do/DeqQ family serine protease|tara:strand:- start:286 stop:1680 length:1395 start_codon:yes stop_codon:yes gene_type:complete